MIVKILSNVVFTIFAICYLPVFLLKIKQAEDPKVLWRERWGVLSIDRFKKKRTRVWLHAVSVGEVKAIESFLKILKSKNFEVFLSTVTPTGQLLAKRLVGARAFYFPFDLTVPVKKSLEQVNPDMILLAETEIWPNFILEAAKRNIPVGVVNGRLSKRSFEGYGWIQPLLKIIFEKISFFLMQTEADSKRICLLGAPESRVCVCGNMKFDSQKEGVEVSSEQLKEQYKIAPDRMVWVVGSTHPGEERKLLSVYTRLQSVFPGLVLILAPRHIERAPEIEKLTKEFNFTVKLASCLDEKGDRFDVLVLDTIGDLKKIYSFSDVVFLGGSFVERGGQNPIEPALYAKPIFSGSHTFNFTFVYEALEGAGGAKKVISEDELFIGLKDFLGDPNRAHQMGQAALQTVEKLSGASRKTANIVDDFLSDKSQPKAKAPVEAAV